MANKFAKAVQNRTNEILSTGMNGEKEKDANSGAAEPSVDISSLFEKEDEKKAKNKTYYLDQEVIDAVKHNAKKQNVSESKLVNNILKHILNIN